MDVNELFNYLDSVLETGDLLERNGWCGSGADAGGLPLRDAMRLELGFFLLYLADLGFVINDGQAALLNLVFRHLSPDLTADQWKEKAFGLETPRVANVSFMMAVEVDKMTKAANGGNATSFAEILFNLYKTFGELMVGMSVSMMSRMHCAGHIRQLESYIASGGTTDGGPYVSPLDKPLPKKTAPTNTDVGSSAKCTGMYNARISFDLPAGYETFDGKDDKGEREFKIKAGPKRNKDGMPAYEREFIISVRTENGATSRKTALDIAREAAKGKATRLAGTPEALLVENTMNINVLGIAASYDIVQLHVALSHKENIYIQQLTLRNDDEPNPHGQTLKHLKTIWDSLKIDGKKVVTAPFDGSMGCKQEKPSRHPKPAQKSTGSQGMIADDGKTIKISQYADNTDIREIVIPEGVETIGMNEFRGCTNLETVVLPKTLKRIGRSAFSGCKALKQIEIPEGVLGIGDDAFQGCRQLETVTLPKGLLIIGQAAFSGCIAIKQIEIPEGVADIKDDVFNGCCKLKRIVLPKTLRKIGNSAFSDCSALKWVEIPNGVTEIGYWAFSNCRELEEVILPNTLRRIGISAFCCCSALSTIKIPNGVEEIGRNAFMDTDWLGELTLPDSLKNVDPKIFGNMPDDACPVVRMSGKLAIRLPEAFKARRYVIDGVTYDSFTDYRRKRAAEEHAKREAEERARLERERREREKREAEERTRLELEKRAREQAERKAEEARKQLRRNEINAEIRRVTDEMNAQKGLFAGMKRKKLQARIDELNEQLKNLI